MEISVSPLLETILGYARDEAVRTGHFGLTVDHLALGALRHGDNEFCTILKSLGIDLDELKGHIDSQVFRPQPISWADSGRVGFARSAVNALNLSVYEALKEDCHQPGPAHLLIGASRCERNAFKDFLDSKGIGTAELAAARAGKLQRPLPKKSNLPDAKDIADALEAELRRVMAEGYSINGGIPS